MRAGALLLAALLSLATGAPAAAEASGMLAIPRTIDEPPTAPAAPPPAGQPPQPETPLDSRNYRQLMRDVIGPLASYARQRNANFVILQRGGADLLFDGTTNDSMMVKSLDGIVLDGPYCGRPAGNGAATLRRSLVSAGLRVLVADRCANPESRASAIERAAKDKVLLYPDRMASQAQPGRPPNENPSHITSIAAARNFLIETRPAGFHTAGEWVAALRQTNHDAVIVDPYFGTTPLTATEVTGLRFKRLGSRRLAIASLSLSFAQPGRHYWGTEWRPGAPSWLGDAEGGRGHLTEYWNDEWKEILGAYLKGLLDLGYDGVMFDDAGIFAHFEKIPSSSTRN